MAKYKIECIIDVDFEKFFDDIPDGLFKDNTKPDENYCLEAIHKTLADVHMSALTNHMQWMSNENYKYVKHHLLIEQEIAKQIHENSEVIKIKK